MRRLAFAPPRRFLDDPSPPMSARPQLQLRPWRDADLDVFAAMNADPEVMRFFPKPLTREESTQAFERLRAGLDERGWGIWVAEVDGEFAGSIGLAEPRFTAHFTPCIEIGWRFRREYWGRGLAFAAARIVERHAFDTLKLRELVAFTAAINLRSRP